jgi:hypothetical protein
MSNYTPFLFILIFILICILFLLIIGFIAFKFSSVWSELVKKYKTDSKNFVGKRVGRIHINISINNYQTSNLVSTEKKFTGWVVIKYNDEGLFLKNKFFFLDSSILIPWDEINVIDVNVLFLKYNKLYIGSKNDSQIETTIFLRRSAFKKFESHCHLYSPLK